MHDERRYRHFFQVRREIRLRECDDAIVMRLRTPHHSLAPPVLDDSLRNLCTRPVEAVERTRRHVPIELGAVIGYLRLESVENVFRKTTGVRRRFDHDRWDRG